MILGIVYRESIQDITFCKACHAQVKVFSRGVGGFVFVLSLNGHFRLLFLCLNFPGGVHPPPPNKKQKNSPSRKKKLQYGLLRCQAAWSDDKLKQHDLKLKPSNIVYRVHIIFLLCIIHVLLYCKSQNNINYIQHNRPTT